MKQLISQTDLANSEGIPKCDYVACVFTCGLSSEAITDPHERGAPFKKARLSKHLNAFAASRKHLHQKQGLTESTLLGPGEMLICLDNQKRGLHQSFMKCAKGEAGSKPAVKAVNIVYDYDSVQARKSRIRGIAAVSQIETMLIMTQTPLVVPKYKFKHFQGSNQGNAIAHVKLAPIQGLLGDDV